LFTQCAELQCEEHTDIEMEKLYVHYHVTGNNMPVATSLSSTGTWA